MLLYDQVEYNISTDDKSKDETVSIIPRGSYHPSALTIIRKGGLRRGTPSIATGTGVGVVHSCKSEELDYESKVYREKDCWPCQCRGKNSKEIATKSLHN